MTKKARIAELERRVAELEAQLAGLRASPFTQPPIVYPPLPYPVPTTSPPWWVHPDFAPPIIVTCGTESRFTVGAEVAPLTFDA